MPKRPRLIHEPNHAPVFHLLFLSEAYDSEVEFWLHCHKLMLWLLDIPPFNLARDRIAAWAQYFPSNHQGIGGDADHVEDTAFGFYANDETPRGVFTRRPQSVIDAIKDCQVAIRSVPDALDVMNAEEIWLNRGLEESAAVCVLIRSGEKRATTQRVWHESLPLDDPDSVTAELEALLPAVYMTVWQFLDSADPAYLNPEEAAAYVLAHELGHFFGLGDEYEEEDGGFERYEVADPDDETAIIEPWEANLMAGAALLDENGQIQPDKLKWRDLVTGPRGDAIREVPHPAAPDPADYEGDPAGYHAELTRRFAEPATHASDAVVLVRHPSREVEQELRARNVLRYVDAPQRSMWMTDRVNLYEGGGYRWLDIYRPSAECLMRYEGYDVAAGQRQWRGPVDFCPVCEDTIRAYLNRLTEVRPGGVRIIPGPDRCVGRKVGSRLARALVRFIEQTTDYPSDDMSCVEATAWRFETFFNDVLGWDRTARQPGRGAPDASGEPRVWYEDPIEMPYLKRHPSAMWWIWNSNLERLRSAQERLDATDARVRLNRWAGLGAPGALWYAGLACLANRLERSTGRPLAVGLSEADLHWLEPGSMLQIWTSRDAYQAIVEYVAGVTDQRPTGFSGHSLYYMGFRDGEHWVADQFSFGQQVPGLTPFSAWTDRNPGYPFWIASQWHDATSVPEF